MTRRRVVPLVWLLSSLLGGWAAQALAQASSPAPSTASAVPAASAGSAAPVAGPASSQNDAATIDARIDAVLGDHAAYAAAFRAFQAAVEKRDTAAAAALVAYPIEVQIGGRKTNIRSAAAFASRYDAILTPAIAQAVIAQRYESLMVSQQGVMLGNGQVWINGVCSDASCKKFTPKVVTIQGSP